MLIDGLVNLLTKTMSRVLEPTIYFTYIQWLNGILDGINSIYGTEYVKFNTIMQINYLFYFGVYANQNHSKWQGDYQNMYSNKGNLIR